MSEEELSNTRVTVNSDSPMGPGEASPGADASAGLNSVQTEAGVAEAGFGAPQVAEAPKSLLGMKRPLAITLMALVLVILLGVAAIIIGNSVAAYNEDRDSAISAHKRSVVDHKAAVVDADSIAGDVREQLLATSSDDLLDAELLSSLQADLDVFENSVANDLELKKFDVEAASNDEIRGEAESLSPRIANIETEVSQLSQSLDLLLADKEAKQAADEKARVAAELAEKKAQAGAVSFEDLFRAGDSVIGTYYRFEGKVIQDSGANTYRVSITQEPGYSRVFWKNPILLTISGDTAQRILEDDIITFVASSMGVQSYESVMGATITLPMVLAEGSDVSVTGRDN